MAAVTRAVTGPALRRPAAAPCRGAGPPGHPLLDLQRAAGNRAVAALVVQRDTAKPGWRTAFEEAQGAPADVRGDRFRRLLASWAGIPFAQTAWAPGALGPDRAPTDLTPGAVNVAPALDASGRHVPARIVPTGDATLPTPTIMVAASLFGQGPVPLRATLEHERRHAFHAAQAAALVTRWRAVRTADTTDAWKAWLRRERTVRKLPVEVVTTTRARTDTSYGTSTTEAYAHLTGFLYIANNLPDAARDPATLSADERKVVDVALGAGSFGEFWQGADSEAQDDVMGKLVAAVRTLDAHRQAHVRRAIGAQRTTVAKGFARRALKDLGWS
jgi:hypothetical protein